MSESVSDNALPGALAITPTDRWQLPFGRPCYDEREVTAVANAIRDGHLASGRIVREFEDAFAAEFGFGHAVAVSSGSTANLLAVAALLESGRLRRGDRVVVSGVTFISAVSPVVQLGMVPVFVDVTAGGVNLDLDLADAAIAATGARAVLFPHTLGQAADLVRLRRLGERHDIAIIEDCCESLGARDGDAAVGAAGIAATFSFYAGHHLTMGEGGVVATNDAATADLLRSLRSFGRDPAYEGGRFGYPVGERRIAAEERYVHLRLGYNGKLTDPQAAFGLMQLGRHADLAAQRRVMAEMVTGTVESHPGWQVLGTPVARGASPFAVACLAPPGRRLADVARALIGHGIDVRGFLGASLPDQPCFDAVDHIVHEPYRWAPEYAARALLVGTPPGVDVDGAATALRRALAEVS
ncbi:DegT/DnrJ/EryC1/StrS family aminotransferase [Micromonospora sp. DT46]|uniref:DegT/DnrJ/EryC1/StrS family aminotransferase n=1 Tax=Micromonospora sp. DT46 TaxID=3393435 RepID=UPI003CEA3EC4